MYFWLIYLPQGVSVLLLNLVRVWLLPIAGRCLIEGQPRYYFFRTDEKEIVSTN